MHPPKVTDLKVRLLIREMAAGGKLPSGAHVRTMLAQRFNCRGGVARVYRLLAEERERLRPAPNPGSPEVLQSELDHVKEKLAHAHEREDAHQSRWAEEVDRLRQKVAVLEPLANQARAAQERFELLRYQLQAAERRVSVLEQELIELQRR